MYIVITSMQIIAVGIEVSGIISKQSQSSSKVLIKIAGIPASKNLQTLPMVFQILDSIHESIALPIPV